jgi:EpsI family protein
MSNSKKEIGLFKQLIRDKKFIAAVLILIICNFVLYKNLLTTSGNNTDAFKTEFPSRISEWTATEVKYNPSVISTLDPDKTIYLNYHNDVSSPITLFIACYNSLEKADLSHSPIVCFTGQGWDIEGTSIREVSLGPPENKTIEVNQMIQNKADAVMITFYWYQTKNIAFSNRGEQKMYLFFQKLLGNSEGNAFVRLTKMVDIGESEESTIMLLTNFMKEFYPELRRYYN